MKFQINENWKGILIILSICLFAYISIFLIWNYTSAEGNRPSSLLWDNRRDGYQEDPLYDRKSNQVD
jgi:hypothetical protein